MPAHRERLSSVNYGGPALVTNGDYLTIRELENNLVLWMFEEGKRCSVTWIRNTLSADGEPAPEVAANLFTASGTGGRPRCHA
jgi:hypothetical protein